MQHPDLTMLIHESKRIDQPRRPQMPPPDDRPGLLSALRTRTGNALIALGMRITPATPRPRRPTRSASAAGS